MKMRLPEGKTLGSPFDTIEVAPDGTFDVNDADAAVLRSHGIPYASEVEETRIEAMTHGQLMALVLKRTADTLEKMPTEELRNRLLSTEQNTVILPDETEGFGANVDAAKVTHEDIEGMSRNDLFAFLKAKGVSVSLPIKNEELRQYAIMAIEDQSKAS